jgi:sRNA-binding protein
MILWIKKPKDSTRKTTRADKQIQEFIRLKEKHAEISDILYTNNKISKEEITVHILSSLEITRAVKVTKGNKGWNIDVIVLILDSEDVRCRLRIKWAPL